MSSPCRAETCAVFARACSYWLNNFIRPNIVIVLWSTGKASVRRADRRWVQRDCAFHSSSQPTSRTRTSALDRTAPASHCTTRSLAGVTERLRNDSSRAMSPVPLAMHRLNNYVIRISICLFRRTGKSFIK